MWNVAVKKNLFNYFLELYAQRRNLSLSSSQIKQLKCEQGEKLRQPAAVDG